MIYPTNGTTHKLYQTCIVRMSAYNVLFRIRVGLTTNYFTREGRETIHGDHRCSKLKLNMFQKNSITELFYLEY